MWLPYFSFNIEISVLMSISEQKETLRQEALKHRSRMHIDTEDPEAAVELFFDTIHMSETQVLAGYWPKDREFDVRYILDEALRRDIQCGLPVVEKDSKILSFAKWDAETELQKASFGILEPKEKAQIIPDVVIVPLLAFDQRGGRLGYGGGYYDATLKALRAKKHILAVGVAYAQQACLFGLPQEDHDEILDLVITPQGLKDFRV